MSNTSVRAVKFKVINLSRETRDRWLRLARQVKRVRNGTWRLWSHWHTERGHDFEVSVYLDCIRAWHKASPAERGPKPQCTIDCLPAELKKDVRARLRELMPDLHERPLELTFNTICNSMMKLKPTQGKFPRWMRVLADEEGVPTSTKQATIPFSKANSIIIPPASDRDAFSIRLRVDRVVHDGKKLATSTEDEVTLQTRRRDNKQVAAAAILKNIAEGVYEHAGANLHFNAGTDDWFVSVCYRVPQRARAKLDLAKVAYLRPARRRPWWLRMESYNCWMGGRTGRHVSHVRQQLLTQRWGRQESYDHASSARKGHGRKRVIGKTYMLRDRWQDFTKTANHTLAKHVVEKMIAEGYGTLVYFQPMNGWAKNKFLHTAGKVEGREDPSSWDFSGLAAILAKLCQDHGIDFVVRRSGETRPAGPAAIQP